MVKSFFASRNTTKKINMLPMCNVKIEHKKFVMYKKQNLFLLLRYNKNYTTMT